MRRKPRKAAGSAKKVTAGKNRPAGTRPGGSSRVLKKRGGANVTTGRGY